MGVRASLLVFDWDGTLMNSETRIVASLAKAIAVVGLQPRSVEALSNIIGLGLREALYALYPDASPVQLVALETAYRDHFLSSSTDSQALFPGVEEVLEALLRRGFLLAVATGKSRAGLDRGMEETNLGRHFCASRCADETASKPDPAMLHELTREFGIRADHCIMIGDTEYDLEMARRAGVASIGANYGVHGATRLRRLGPLACLDDIRELPATLDTLRVKAIPL
jgi:phosphoglycolate phosphatase